MKLIGTVEDIIFVNEQNGYKVLGISSNDALFTAVGITPDISIGQFVEIEGELVNNTKYGEQVNIKEIKFLKPNTLLAIEKYLGSGLIRGIGPITANKIVSHFGKDTLDIIETVPTKLSEVNGISKKKAIEISAQFSELKNMQDSLIFLQSHNITVNLAIKIFNIYKNSTIEMVKNNPYKLCEDIDGIGFFSADKIASTFEIDNKSEQRIRAGVTHCIKASSDNEGHTYIPLENLIKATKKLLSLDDNDTNKIEQVINFLTIDGTIINLKLFNTEVVMLTKYYTFEKYIAKKLLALNQNQFENNIDFSSQIEFYQKNYNITLNIEQQNAILLAMKNGVSIITGGPGTGKTTIINGILKLLEQDRKTVLLLAPTGRASKRLSETSGKQAKTIHRALEMINTGRGTIFNKNTNNPLQADVIIIDEMSMVDVSLFYYLLKAVKNSTRLVIVGDKDQLPSVSNGNVLKDMIDSEIISITQLTKIYRQSEKSLIVSNAHLVNTGKMPVIDNSSIDFFFEIDDNQYSCAEKIVDLVSSRLPDFTKLSNKKIQVLAPMRVGVCGIENLNAKLQDRINPYNKNNVQVFTERITYRINDKVMQTSNNYDMEWIKYDDFGGSEKGEGVFNGDIGYITHIAPNTFETTVQFDDGRIAIYTRSELNELTLAYAITIHKSQGSEFDCIVVPLVSGAPIILTRNLLYTAITRAKKLVVLVGSKENLSRMVKNNYTTFRFTMLKNFLLQRIV